MLKRSLFFYLIFAIILLKVNLGEIHYQRVVFLGWSAEAVRQGQDIPATILYYDYLRRLSPADTPSWENLIKAYILSNDFAGAREALSQLLRTAQKSKLNQLELLELYKNLDAQLKKLEILP